LCCGSVLSPILAFYVGVLPDLKRPRYHPYMATHTLMTAEQFDQLPEEEGKRHELLDGELIEMASANLEHNVILTNGLFELEMFFRQHPVGRAIPETEFALGTERLQPDIAVLLGEKYGQADRRRIPVVVVPDIAVEIVLPSEPAAHLDHKVRAYLQAGVAEAWVIYPDGRHMYVHTGAGARFLADTDVLETPVLPGWSMPVGNLFV
jgi:Uma2 family endonuclease